MNSGFILELYFFIYKIQYNTYNWSHNLFSQRSNVGFFCGNMGDIRDFFLHFFFSFFLLFSVFFFFVSFIFPFFSFFLNHPIEI